MVHGEGRGGRKGGCESEVLPAGDALQGSGSAQNTGFGGIDLKDLERAGREFRIVLCCTDELE